MCKYQILYLDRIGLTIVAWRHLVNNIDLIIIMALSFRVIRVTPSNLWKSFTVLETRVFQAADGEDLVIIACTIFD